MKAARNQSMIPISYCVTSFAMDFGKGEHGHTCQAAISVECCMLGVTATNCRIGQCAVVKQCHYLDTSLRRTPCSAPEAC